MEVGSRGVIAEVSLTPLQAKIVIARAVARLEVVSQALKVGTIVIHPSSSTLPVVQQLIGALPHEMWVLGMVRPKGLCISFERQEAARRGQALGGDPGRFQYSWVIHRGVLQEPQSLGTVLAVLGPHDVYIKGCNALDPWGNAGVLFASPGAGTIGLVLAARRKRGFKMVLPVGLEKLIPGSVADAARVVSYHRIRYATGQKCGLVPVPGEVVHEARALEMLFGIKCYVIAAGGLGGGEGSTVLMLRGEQTAVEEAFNFVLDLKAVRGPVVRETECQGCPISRCLMPR